VGNPCPGEGITATELQLLACFEVKPHLRLQLRPRFEITQWFAAEA
jgi:hypothetical protein